MAATEYFKNKNHYADYKSVKSELIRSSKFDKEINFSIVIPTFGRAELLNHAIRSCIHQTYNGDFEILIVDNDPVRSNETEKLVQGIADDRIKYYKNRENMGCLPNFNRCIELACSKYIFMLHTDDLLDDTYLETVIPLLETHPEIDMLIPGKRIIRKEIISRQKGFSYLARKLGLTKTAVPLNERDFCYYNITGGPLGIVMKRDACLKLGGFDENLFPMSDYAFWVRYVRNFNVFYLPKELGTYRFFNNISSEDGMQRNYIENEFKLIIELISDKSYSLLMHGYLYEYINYRVKKAGLNRADVFSSITGSDYKHNILLKLRYAAAIVIGSFSFLRRSFSSKIKV